MNYATLELISYFSGFLGIIISLILLISTKGKKAIRYSLASVLAIGSIVVILGTLNYSGKIVYFIHLIRMDSPLGYLFGPAVYFYTLATFKSNFRLRKIHLLHLLPFILNIIEFAPLYLSDTEFKLDYFNTIRAQGSYVMPFHYLMKTLSSSGYFVAQLIIFWKYQIKQNQANTKHSSLVTWFFIYFASQFVMITGFLIDHLTGLNLMKDPYIFAMVMITVFLYSIELALLFFPRLLYGNIYYENFVREKYSKSKLSEDDKKAMSSQLFAYMTSDAKPFLNPKLSLSEISTILKINAQQLSQVINEKKHLNFNDFINSYRIEEAKEMLVSPAYKNITIDAIAQKAGFNSKSAFYNAFSKQIGLTPKQYINSLVVEKTIKL